MSISSLVVTISLRVLVTVVQSWQSSWAAVAVSTVIMNRLIIMRAKSAILTPTILISFHGN